MKPLLNDLLTSAEIKVRLGLGARRANRLFPVEVEHLWNPAFSLRRVLIRDFRHLCAIVRPTQGRERTEILPKVARLLRERRAATWEQGDGRLEPPAPARNRPLVARISQVVRDSQCPRPLLLLALLLERDDWSAAGVVEAERRGARILAADWARVERHLRRRHARYVTRLDDLAMEDGRVGYLSSLGKFTWPLGERRDSGGYLRNAGNLLVLARVDFSPEEVTAALLSLAPLAPRSWMYEQGRRLGCAASARAWLRGVFAAVQNAAA